VNLAWLDTLDEQLCARASQLFNKRAKAIAEMQEQFNTIHQKLSRHNEYVQLEYVSQCQQGMLIDKIKARQALDFQIKRSTVGTHRDDVQLHIDGHEAKKIASQGQLKTILLAMKLAELQWIKQHTIRTPILLLDDVFDKLDPHRIKELLQVVHQLHVQVFITDTDAARLVKITSENNQKYELIELCE
jgi:DNA replication and repair protein RecF